MEEMKRSKTGLLLRELEIPEEIFLFLGRSREGELTVKIMPATSEGHKIERPACRGFFFFLMITLLINIRK